MVIVNKKQHFKKVPLFIFQFPSPPIWNNWLSHLLNLYSFVIYTYSSSNHFFVSSHLFFFPLTRPHEVEEWWLAAHFGPYWFVLAEIGPILLFWLKSDRFCCFGSCFCRNRVESAWIRKKKGWIGALDTALGQVQCRCGDLGAIPMLSW